MSAPDRTYPHDYRLICAGQPPAVVVGGQAVNLWAISYLDPDTEGITTRFGSADLDVLADPALITRLKQLPGWGYRPNDLKNFLDARIAFMSSVSSDNRRLLVEILHRVHGLDKADLSAVEVVSYDGTEYRLLDPIVMLKSKAANVRDINQDGPPPRQDRVHLQLLARCWPAYLRDIHEAAVVQPESEKDALAVISRAFKVLQHRRTAQTLAAAGIDRRSLIPEELADSPLSRIKDAFKWQAPSLDK